MHIGKVSRRQTSQDTYHSPPEGVCITVELWPRVRLRVLLRQVHEVRGEDQAQEPDVQSRDQLLGADQQTTYRDIV